MAQNVLLMILDGWGKSPDPKVSAVDQAKTPYIDSLYKEYHHAELRTDGQHVGLPEGQMGNSEVGHMNLGAGRIVYQDLAKISRAIDRQEIAQEPELKEAMAYALKHQKPIHLMGLLSDGGVHSHIEHLEGLMDVLSAQKFRFTYTPFPMVGTWTPNRGSVLSNASLLSYRLQADNWPQLLVGTMPWTATNAGNGSKSL